MKTTLLFLIMACAAFLAGCSASEPPPELVNARIAYQHASESSAATLVPAELHKAEAALALAEASFKNDPHSFTTRDLSYVADRKAKTAEAMAATAAGTATSAQATKDYQNTQSQIMIKTQKDLAAQTQSTRNANDNLAASQRSNDVTNQQLAAQTAISRNASDSLAASQRNNSATSAQLASEQQAHADADARADSAQAALIKLAAVKEEARGLVITLSGSVLFASSQSELLPSAQVTLNQVVDALLQTKERGLVVEGYTDSQGSDDYNLDLSQRRAEAVRSYIISRGYNADLIQAHGIGKDSPVADNGTAEGRANNRRVEIIVASR
jgi:outer membrane protein OmpA-like peptidoglycan-associated protein